MTENVEPAEQRLTAGIVKAALEGGLDSQGAADLAVRVRDTIGETSLLQGAQPRVDGQTLLFAITSADATSPPHVVSDKSHTFDLPLTRLGQTDVYLATIDVPEGAALRWTYHVDGTPHATGQFEVHVVESETERRSDVPEGVVTKQPIWRSNIFAGTERDWWVYIPDQYREDQPANVMIFQDGAFYRSFVPATFDNLIADGSMPVTIGIFIDPGHRTGEEYEMRSGVFKAGPGSNRSFEYDTLSDQYTRFLLEEILPEVSRSHNLTQNAAGRAIGGFSSGGICAFTVAWERPDQFSKVLSWVGSFANIAHGESMREGGHNYQALIRRLPRKPIRVFLQDGENDLVNVSGNWWLANLEMDDALRFAEYDYIFVHGKGFHSGYHGRAILPSSLRWLWRPEKCDMTAITLASCPDHTRDS